MESDKIIGGIIFLIFGRLLIYDFMPIYMQSTRQVSGCNSFFGLGEIIAPKVCNEWVEIYRLSIVEGLIGGISTIVRLVFADVGIARGNESDSNQKYSYHQSDNVDQQFNSEIKIYCRYCGQVRALEGDNLYTLWSYFRLTDPDKEEMSIL